MVATFELKLACFVVGRVSVDNRPPPGPDQINDLMVGHTHDPATGLAAFCIESERFQPDVQEDVLGDLFSQGWLLEHEHRQRIHRSMVPGVKGLKGIHVHLGYPLHQLIVV